METTPSIKPFVCDTRDKAVLADEWKKWVRSVQIYFEAEEITDVVKKKNKLLHLGGPQLQQVAFNIPGAIQYYDPQRQNDVFKTLTDALDDFFSPPQNSCFQRHLFRNLKPEEGETLNTFLMRCRTQASKCSFGNSELEAREINIKDKLIDVWAPVDLKRKLLETEAPLHHVIALCEMYEQTKQQSKTMEHTPSGESTSEGYQMANKSSMKEREDIINNYPTRSSDDAECSGTQNKRVKYEHENIGGSTDITIHGQCTDNKPSEVEPSTSSLEQEFSNSLKITQESEINCAATLETESKHSHFTILSKEWSILIKIFRDVTTRDLWNFCEAYKDFEYLRKEIPLTRNINLQSWYNDVNINTLFNTLNPEYITCINLNGCHWLPREDLLSFISKCVNLETLLARRTQLELSEQDIESYTKSKIRTLAVSVQTKNKTLATKGVLDKVTHLTLEIDCWMNNVGSPENFNKMFPRLQTIWGQLHEIIWCGPFNYFTKSDLSEISAATNLHLYYFGNSSTTFNKTKSTACFGNMLHKLKDPNSLFSNKVNSKPENIHAIPLPIEWQALEDLHLQKPYSHKDAKRLHLGARTLDTIQFEELNLYQSHPHKPDCNQALSKILGLPNTRNIKRLTICICLLEEYKKIDKPQVAVLNGFKELRTLRLFRCNYLPFPVDLGSSIANLKQLRHLDVEIPFGSDGQFLLEVLRECAQLETLWIEYYSPDIFNRCGYNPFKYSVNLKELVLRSNDIIRINGLLTLLINSKHMKLRKLLLKCQQTDRFEGIESEFWRLHVDELLQKEGADCAGRFNSYLTYTPHLEYFSLDLLSEFMRSSTQLTHCEFYILRNFHKTQATFIKKQVRTFNMPHIYFNVDSKIHRSQSAKWCSHFML